MVVLHVERTSRRVGRVLQIKDAEEFPGASGDPRTCLPASEKNVVHAAFMGIFLIVAKEAVSTISMPASGSFP